MKSHYVRLLLSVMLVTILGLLLVACGGGDEEPVSPTAVPEQPAADTPAPLPTDTPEPPPPTDTPVPTAVPEPEIGSDFVPFESTEGGFSLRYPDGWFTAELFGFAMFASNEALLDSPDMGEEGGVAVVIGGDAAEFEASDPIALLEEAVAEFDLSNGSEMVEGPTEVTINGQDAATAVIKSTTDDGTPLTTFLTVIASGNRVMVVMTATHSATEAEFRPQFEAIVNSIEMFEPVAAPPPQSQGILLFGVTETSSVTDSSGSAWEFIGLEGETIDIIVRPLADDFDLIFDLLDESGSSVLDFEVDESFGLEELRDFALPVSGTYTISVYGFAGAIGDYEITLAEAGATAGTATGSIGYGSLMTGAVVSGETASWTFDGQARDYVDITVAPFDFDLTVDVLDPSGISLLDESPLDESFDTEFIRILALPEDGTYTIVVGGFEDEFGDYEIAVDLSNGGLPGSIVFAADTLEESESAEGHAFPFTALAGEVVSFIVESEFGFDTVIEIVNDDTDEVIEEIDASTGFEEAIFSVPEDGNYFFQVKGFEGSFGEYDATLLGSDFVIFELAVGDGVIGRFGADGVIDYIYRGTAGDTVVFTAESEDDLDLLMTMADLDDNVLLTVDEFVEGGSETLSYTFTEDLIVFLTVSEFNATPGQFVLFVDAE